VILRIAEVDMVLQAGAKSVTWAYPSVNPANVCRFVEAARRYPDAEVVGLVDSPRVLQVWREALLNLRLRIDLDPGTGCTGAPM